MLREEDKRTLDKIVRLRIGQSALNRVADTLSWNALEQKMRVLKAELSPGTLDRPEAKAHMFSVLTQLSADSHLLEAA